MPIDDTRPNADTWRYGAMMYVSVLSILRRRRGSATTEKLLVLVVGVMLVVPALLLFGPLVQAKIAVVVEALGGPPANSLAVREAKSGSSDTILYVIFFAGLSLAFSIVFVFPLLFRRLRIRRQVIINDLAERFPFLEPLADRSVEFERNMRELKDLADEVRDIEPPRASALQVAVPDLGLQASPADVTMTNDSLPKIVMDQSPEETIPGSMVAPTALRNTGPNAAIRQTGGLTPPSQGLQPMGFGPQAGVAPMAGPQPGVVPSQVQRPQAPAQQPWGTPMYGSAAVQPRSPMQPLQSQPAAPVTNASWAPTPQPHPQPLPPAAPSLQRTPSSAFELPSLGSLVDDEENIATVDVRDPSLLTSLPMSEFRDKLKSYDPDQTVMPNKLDLETTRPKRGSAQVPTSQDVTLDWGNKPIDE